MNKISLANQISEKKSMLCIGLDTDILRIPELITNHFDDPVFEFNRRIIEATSDLCVAYKFNIAFYESLGADGWASLQKSLEIIPETHFKIADAKRGDIGNSSKMYARTYFETFSFDAITVAPYMGKDSIEPFYSYRDKWVIILGLTSNSGSRDFQMLLTESENYLFEDVIRKCSEIGTSSNTMFVVGATNSEYLGRVRRIVPDHFLLLPGIGKQGGDIETSLRHGLNSENGLLLNSSRGIIYASDKGDFDKEARKAAQNLNGMILKEWIKMQ